MSDIRLKWQSGAFIADMSMSGPDIETGDELTSAVIMSLFTWRRANPDDALPDYQTGRMGWWADTFPSVENDKIGSRLWLLKREKLTPETVNRAVEYAKEAVQWLVDDGVVSRIDVWAERQGLTMLALGIVVYRHDGTRRTLEFGNVWEAIQNG